MTALDTPLIVRVDIDAAHLAEVLTSLADVAQQVADAILAARDLLDESQATTEADQDSAARDGAL